MQRLLDAGVEVFAARGYHAARVDDIVKVAQTSHGTFYLYFANKEELFRALAENVATEMRALADALPPIVVAASLQIPASILSEASLRFLGLSEPNSLSWGGMLNQAQNFLQQAWWMPLFPGLAIFLTVLSFNLAGEALNEGLDPRRRG